MATGEAQVKYEIRRSLGSYQYLRLFNNAVGVVKDGQGNTFRFGLAPGSADLIGWYTKEITKEHIGKKIAQFLAIEVKAPGGRLSEIQQNFLDTVIAHGGLAGVARSTEDAELIIQG